MNETKFTELANLYFDREISTADLEILKQELASNPTRKHEFESRYRLHQAMRMVLSPDDIFQADFAVQSARKASRTGRLTAWVCASGLAACFSIGFVLLGPATVDTTATRATLPDEGESPKALSRAEIARFSATQEDQAELRCSLASHLRLLGLSPDITSNGRELSSVDHVALQQREARRQQEIEQINQYKAYNAMPEPQLLESQDASTQGPAGFQASLVSFK